MHLTCACPTLDPGDGFLREDVIDLKTKCLAYAVFIDDVEHVVIVLGICDHSLLLATQAENADEATLVDGDDCEGRLWSFAVAGPD